jgi:hypothetical protein
MTEPYDPYEETRRTRYPHAPVPRQSRIGEVRMPSTAPEVTIKVEGVQTLIMLMMMLVIIMAVTGLQVTWLSGEYRRVHAHEIEAAKAAAKAVEAAK